MFRGIEPSGTGQIMGHEFVGHVVEAGDAVKTVQKGDTVVASFTTSWYVPLPLLQIEICLSLHARPSRTRARLLFINEQTMYQ